MDKISPAIIEVRNSSCWEESTVLPETSKKLHIDALSLVCSNTGNVKEYAVRTDDELVNETLGAPSSVQSCVSAETMADLEWSEQGADDIGGCSSDAGSTPRAHSQGGGDMEACSSKDSMAVNGISGVSAGPTNGARMEIKDSRIQIMLEGADLWRQFCAVGTEMIITKAGRRMFPALVVSISGLEPEVKYGLVVEMCVAGNHRYKYLNSKWVVVSKGDVHNEDQLRFTHPDSPASGKHWMSSKVSFKKIKLTNNKCSSSSKKTHVALNSMHKYTPRIIVSRYTTKKTSHIIHTQDFNECTFIAVTAYQNDQVTQLKIDNNPFAKAFRDNSSEPDLPYGYQGILNGWPPTTPLMHTYSRDLYTSGSLEGQGLGQTMASNITTFQHSPMPQLSTTFSTWESSSYPQGYRHHLSTSPGGLSSSSSIIGLPDPNKLLWNMSRLATESPPISPRMYSPSLYPYSPIGDSQLRQYSGMYSTSPSSAKNPYTSAILSNRISQPLQSPSVGYTPYGSTVGMKMLPPFQQLITKAEVPRDQ